MTQLYECDHCGDHVEVVGETLYVKVSNGILSPHGTSHKEAYHVCWDCWESLGWDDEVEDDASV